MHNTRADFYRGRFCLVTLALIAVLAPAAFAQTASTDAQLTQTLINELRQLRQDLQVTAAVVQRAQILMYRLQVETGILQRAQQRLDNARNTCTQSQSQLKNLAMQIEQMEARLRAAQNPTEQKTVEDSLNRLKSTQALYASMEQQCRPQEIDAQNQTQAAQARVDDFQSQLDRLDKALAGVIPR